MKKFEQLKRQYQTLSGYLDETDLSDKNISASASDFDRLFELSWKTLKAYLYDSLGIYEAKTGSPREILKLAAAEDLLQDDQIWLSMLKDRNDDAHIYCKADAVVYMSRIAGSYLPVIGELIASLKERIPDEQLEEVQIPQDMLEYAKLHHKPLYVLTDEIRKKYNCRTSAQIYMHWEEYKKFLTTL